MFAMAPSGVKGRAADDAGGGLVVASGRGGRWCIVPWVGHPEATFNGNDEAVIRNNAAII